MPVQVRRLESECYSLMQTVATDKLLRSLDTFTAPIMLCDMAARGWPILHANEAWVKRLGAWPACRCILALCNRAVHPVVIEPAFAVLRMGALRSV